MTEEVKRKESLPRYVSVAGPRKNGIINLSDAPALSIKEREQLAKQSTHQQ